MSGPNRPPMTEKQVALVLEIQRQLKCHGEFSPFRAAHAPESVMTGGWVERVDVRGQARKPTAIYGILHTLMRQGHITAPKVAGVLDWTRVTVLTPVTDEGQVDPRGIITHHHILGGGRTVLIQANMVPGATAYGFCARSCPARGIYEDDVLWLDGSVRGRPRTEHLHAVQVAPWVLKPGQVLLAVPDKGRYETRWLDAHSVDEGAPFVIEGVIQQLRVCAVLSTNMTRGGLCQDARTET